MHSALFEKTFHYIVTMTVFGLLWHAGSVAIANPVLLPSPLNVGANLLDLLARGEVQESALVSTRRLLASFALAGAVAIPLGFLMGLNRTVFALVDPVVEMLRPISGIAWIPLGLFIFGIGETLPTAIMFYGAFFPLLLNTIAGVRTVAPNIVAAARVMGVGRHIVLVHVILPAALPSILVGARLAMGAGWMAMIAAELIGAPSGLGYSIEWYRSLLMTPKVMAFVVVIGCLGYVMDALLRLLQSVLTPWAMPEAGR
ncbi:ABC transporter permease [Shinella sp. BYT-45]|uniref:ABC transporter permease n=1 Tax=Shinella sp. BYT-45 TaxID=3377377 RepID=UPI0039811E2D